jgi:NAD(P)-dependent dehydrogenase (short-subunit alcohol dehydrogenase family)
MYSRSFNRMAAWSGEEAGVIDRRAFDGKTVLVTGAARGIGRATAEAFARAGASVALLDRDSVALQPVVTAIGEGGGRAIALVADVARRADIEQAVDECVKAYGGLDVLVGNAGIHFARAIDEYTDEEWDLIVSVNLTGTFYVIRAALPALRRSRGAIVLVSSMTALVGQARGAAYVATKGALVSLTKGLALELAADGIRVNCVCPAGVDTPLMRSWAETLPDPAAILQQQAAMHLMNRMASADEIAAAIAFLASPAASFITGVALPIEGGATLGYRR